MATVWMVERCKKQTNKQKHKIHLCISLHHKLKRNAFALTSVMLTPFFRHFLLLAFPFLPSSFPTPKQINMIKRSRNGENISQPRAKNVQ